MTHTLDCPNCGAPLDYPGGDSPTMRCPFCKTSVVVPDELRSVPEPVTVDFQKIIGQIETAAGSQARSRSKVGLIALFFTLFLIFGVTLTAIIVIKSINNETTGAELSSGAVPTAVMMATPSDVPTLTPLPAFAAAALTFGQEGIGVGMFDNPAEIAVDGQGMIYVADYEGGRIQVFDSSGAYQRQWKAGGSEAHIYGMAASYAGEVYVSLEEGIAVFNGATGERVSTLTSPDGGEFGSLAVTADGKLLAAWYEGRWGIITSLEGHREDLFIFSPQGELETRVQSIVSAQTGDSALDNLIAVDGAGNIAILSDDQVFTYTPEGKYVSRFGGSGDQPGQFSSPRAIAVDGQGRVYVSDTGAVQVFSADGRYLDAFSTADWVKSMVFDEQGALWALSNKSVSQYVLAVQP